ncbi:MAG: AMP-binding protein [Acidimicrobiales bacterium]
MTIAIPGRREIDADTVRLYHERGWWRERTFLDDFDEQVARRADQAAIVAYRTGAPLPVTLTYGQLDTLSRRFAGALLELGVAPGEAVSLQLPNGWEFPALALGILRAGAVVNPLVPIFRHRELSFILGRTESRIVVVPRLFRGFDHGALAAQLVRELPALTHAFVVGGEPPDGARSFEAHFLERRWEDDRSLAGALAARRPRADQLVEIQFTSGTTGEPKGVLHDFNTIYSGGRALRDALGFTEHDTCFMASTLAHQTGFLYGLLQPLSMGMKVVYQDVWNAAEMIAIVDAEQVAFTVSATPFVLDMIAAQREAGRSLASFKYFICGGAPIPPHVVAEAQEVLDAELIAVWGMTENAVVTTTRPGQPVEVVSSSDGTPVDWMEIRVVDDDLVERPVGETGRLQVRGPSQALGYFHRPDVYAEATTPDGWFDTGDLAWRREDGGIRISGRRKDLVIRGGENIPVVEVEAVLYTHPKVREVAVIGLPDERLGERACAVVAPEGEPPTLAELTAHLAEQGAAKQYWPERLELVDEMPKTPSGKIQKFQLRQRFG